MASKMDHGSGEKMDRNLKLDTLQKSVSTLSL